MAPQFFVAQRVFMVKTYTQTRNYVQTKHPFRHQFPNSHKPSKFAIKWNYEKYNVHGTSLNRNKDNSGKWKIARSNQNIAAVLQELQKKPRSSSRKNNVPQISPSSFHRIKKCDLYWHPYRIQHRHALLLHDYVWKFQIK